MNPPDWILLIAGAWIGFGVALIGVGILAERDRTRPGGW